MGQEEEDADEVELELELQQELQRQIEAVDEDEDACDDVGEPSTKRHKQGQEGKATTASECGECSTSTSSTSASLEDLAMELILRVMLNLSAQDLASVAQTCKGLHEISSEDLLWKRLYYFRWGTRSRLGNSREFSSLSLPSQHQLSGDLDLEEDGHDPPRFVWRKVYLDRARLTLKDSVHGACDVMRQHILQMHAHLWSAPPQHDHRQGGNMEHSLGLFFQGGGRRSDYEGGGGAQGETTGRDNRHGGHRQVSSSGPTIHELVQKYRRENKMDSQGAPNHNCSGNTCTFHKLQGCRNVFICESSGNFHVCDRKCKYKEFDHRHEIYVCTISGHVFDGELAEDGEGDGHVTEGMHFDSKMDGGSNHKTWLANAYEAGYFAENMEELKATF